MNRLKKSVAVCLATTITIVTSLTTFANTEGVKNKIDTLMGFSYGAMFALNDALKTNFIISKYNEVKSSVKEVIDDTYKNESGWWNEYIALPIYFNVLNGYEDGTLKPTQSVKACELVKIVATAYELTIQEVDGLNNADFNGQWYNKYYNAIAKAFTYPKSTLMTQEYMNSNMRRCEVAYVLASVSDDGTLKDYIAKAERGDISQMAGYVDFVNVVKTDVDLSVEQSQMNAGNIPARFAGAVMYLQDKGIMVGDGAAHINPLDNVTRAEVFKLIQTTCQNTASYTKNKFYGWEKLPTSGTVTYQPGQTQMTEQTVLNPNAPAELQYKVSDINVNSYDYILNGKANIAEKQLSKAYTQPIVDQVKSTIQFNSGSTTVTVPDLKSDYHEVVIKYYKNVNGNMQGCTVYRGSQQSGTITLDGDCYGIQISVEGRADKATDEAASSYTVSYSIESGAWKSY